MSIIFRVLFYSVHLSFFLLFNLKFDWCQRDRVHVLLNEEAHE